MWCTSRNIDFESMAKKSTRRKQFLKSTFGINKLHFLKGVAWLIREVCFSMPFMFLKPKDWSVSDAKAIFVSYLSTTQVDNLYERDFNSAFWGPLPEYLIKNGISTSWLFLPSNRFNLATIFNAFAALQQKKKRSK